MITLRDYQQEAFDKMMSVTEGRYGLVYPPGAGKTIIFTRYVQQHPDRTHLVIVHRDELISQTVEKLQRLGVAASIEKADSRASPGDFAASLARLNAKKEKFSARIDVLTVSLVSLKEREAMLAQKLDFLEEENQKARDLYQADLEQHRLQLGERSVAYREYFQQRTALYQRQLRSTGRLVRTTSVTLPERAGLYQASIKHNQRLHDEVSKLYQEEPASVVIASVQSLHAERLPSWPPDMFDDIVVDEAHHLQADSWQKVIEHFDAPLCFGFSATWKPESVGFKLLCTKDGPTLMQAGWLVPPEHIILDVREKIIADTLQHDELIAQVLCENRQEKTIVFCSSVDQVHRLEATLKDQGLALGAVSTRTKLAERKDIVQKFREGRLNVFLNYQIVYEGFDDPGSTMIVARNTINPDVYVQSVGRGFRPAENKYTVKIVDILTRDEQCTLPTLFGMHRDWVFERDPLQDYLDAARFAADNKLNLKLYPNWGFLRAKRTPAEYHKPRRHSTPYKETLGDTFKITNYGKKYATGVFFGGSKFYTPTETLRHAVKEILSHELTFAPVKNIESSKVPIVAEKLEGLALKRAIAMQNLRQHRTKNGFLTKLYYTSRRYPLTEAQCDAINRIGADIDAIERQDAADQSSQSIAGQ